MLKTIRRAVAAFIALVPLITAAPAINAAESTVHTYEPDFTGVFANPERGYSMDCDVVNLSSEGRWPYAAQNYRELGSTILESSIHLNDYVNTPELPVSLLDKITSGLNIVRKSRMKIKLRVIYAQSGAPVLTEEYYMRHIEQLAKIITANSDIVYCVEAGVLGDCGEWWGDDKRTTDLESKEQAALRYRLVKKWLDLTPDNVTVLVRWEIQYDELLFMAKNPPSGSGKLTQKQIDRLGLHNDGFPGDPVINTHLYYKSDMKAWWNDSYPVFTRDNFGQRLIEISHSTSTGGNIMSGGEALWVTAPGGEWGAGPADAEYDLRAENEMKQAHITFMQTVWQDQENGGGNVTTFAAKGNDPKENAYTRFNRKMGYRLRLTTADFADSYKKGDTFKLSAKISNDGYAGIVNERPIFVVFDNGTSRYDIQIINTDVRKWTPGEHKLDTSFKLPSDMKAGEYAVSLWLPDLAVSLRQRPEYSVRFANKGIWAAKLGYNCLGTITYTGDGETKPVPLSDEFKNVLRDGSFDSAYEHFPYELVAKTSPKPGDDALSYATWENDFVIEQSKYSNAFVVEMDTSLLDGGFWVSYNNFQDDDDTWYSFDKNSGRVYVEKGKLILKTSGLVPAEQIFLFCKDPKAYSTVKRVYFDKIK